MAVVDRTRTCSALARLFCSATCFIERGGTVTVCSTGANVGSSLLCRTSNEASAVERFTMPTLERYCPLTRWPRMAALVELIFEVSMGGNDCDIVPPSLLPGCGVQIREVAKS